MRLTVAVLTYRSATTLPDLVASLPQGLAGVDHRQLVIVDNGSDDGTVEVARRLAPTAHLVELGANRGFAASVNAAAAADPDSDAVLILSPTARLRPDCVRRMLPALRRPGIGLAVPRLYGGAGQPRLSLRRRPTIARALGEAVLGGRLACRFPALSELVADPAAYRRATIADWATGGVTLVSRACLNAVGAWDESFFLYSEETDFELRAADAGYQLTLVPDAEAVHLGGQSRVIPALYGVLTCNKVRLYAMRHGTRWALPFWSAVTLGEALRSLAIVTDRDRIHRQALRKLLRERTALTHGRPTQLPAEHVSAGRAAA
jgi:N-acetylglucosaminyl-diphospho-decaprenol L-rhamnosyltransferase